MKQVRDNSAPPDHAWIVSDRVPALLILNMSNQSTKPCPRCDRPCNLSYGSGGLDGHTAHTVGHEAFKNAAHGHPFIAGLWLAAAGIKALMPKKYFCKICNKEFTV